MSKRLFSDHFRTCHISMMFTTYLAVLLSCFVCYISVHRAAATEVVFAVNCGGPGHRDVHGVDYEGDPLDIGVASDFGKNLAVIGRVPQQDAILYQTERYDVNTFGYTTSIEEDGDYVLVLKFCEVWFGASRQKVFDVVLNDLHTVVSGLDIYDVAGRGTAHDEIIPFSITKGKLKVQKEASTFHGDLHIEFVKGDYDNPKVNAIVIYKGTVDDIPKLPPLPGADLDEDEPEDSDDEETEEHKPKRHITSGPKTPDPYAADESSFLYPILIALAIFIPTLFCLCRL
ncbi:malectin-A-like [Patiria miniata]|uniref:Malectin domain-containing protein n=1 Tax=Patiria miniata TaxID=46514 RepID=A0A914A6Q6_PATMI|nr:malectin-A-like [Patiria miniata]